ncbi:uncharacterized protein LOC111122804 isoform X3 [Crassostrea virginica]
MVKGSVPMRVRRRQSDAKWRASVAMCYDTLKSIIPNNEKLSKRKISKAYILQETEKHIVNLERALQEILDQKVKMKNKAALYRTEQGLVEANVGDLKNHFSQKQHELYVQNYTQRKRSRCNIPSDMESGLVDLRSSLCDLVVLPAECLKKDLQQMEKDAVVPVSGDELLNLQKPCSVVRTEGSQIVGSLASTSPKEQNKEAFLYTGAATEQHSTVFMQRMEQDMPHHFFLTPIKFPQCSAQPIHHFVSPPPGIRTFCGFSLDRTPSSERQSKSRSPSKKVIRKMQFDSKGFTPVKIDKVGFTPVKFGMKCFTPVKLPEPEDQGVPDSPFTLISGRLCEEEEEGELSLSDLLCTESIDQMDLEDEGDIPKQNQSTPNHRRSRVQKKSKEERYRGRSRSMSEDKRESKEKRCRRQLEKSFCSGRNVTEAGQLDSLSHKEEDSDYLMFCHHLDNEKYSMAANKMSQTTEHEHGYFNVGTLLNNQSDVSSWSSQEVNVSQSQELSEVNQVVPGAGFDTLFSPPPPSQTLFLPYKGKQEVQYDDTDFFTISEDVATECSRKETMSSQVVPEFDSFPHEQQVLF